MRDANLETSITISSLDTPASNFAAVQNAIAVLRQQYGIVIPPPPDPTDTRCTFLVLAPGNTPRNGSSMRIYNGLADSDTAAWWLLANILKVFRKGYTVPGAERFDAYIFVCKLLFTSGCPYINH